MSESLPPEQTIMLADYQYDIDLYKFYINFVLKVNAFQYAMTTAILGVVLSNSSEPYFLFLLAFPAIFSITLILISFKGYPRVKDLQEGITNRSEKLNMYTYPDFTTLKVLIGATVVTHSTLLLCFLAVAFYILPVSCSFLGAQP